MNTIRTPRWALSPRDMQSHVLVDNGRDPIGIMLAVCGHIMPNSVDTGPRPTGGRCEACDAHAALDVASPHLRTTPDSAGQKDLGRTGTAL